MKYTNWLQSLSQLFALIALVMISLSQISIAQPVGLYQVQEGDLIFQDQMEVVTHPSSIELDVTLSTKGNNEANTTTDHNNRIEQLTNLVSASGGQLVDSDNIQLVKASGILKIRSAERTAVSNFKILLYSDQQLSNIIETLFQTDGTDISGYEVIFEVSDNDPTTELTNKIISTISAHSRETGTQVVPKGLSQMDVNSQDFGLDYMDSLVAGFVLEGWKQSENEITLIQRSTKVELTLVAN